MNNKVLCNEWCILINWNKNKVIWHITNDAESDRAATALATTPETKMDMMRKSNSQLMVSCFNVWWRSFVITMVADFLHNRRGNLKLVFIQTLVRRSRSQVWDIIIIVINWECYICYCDRARQWITNNDCSDQLVTTPAPKSGRV